MKTSISGSPLGCHEAEISIIVSLSSPRTRLEGRVGPCLLLLRSAPTVHPGAHPLSSLPSQHVVGHLTAGRAPDLPLLVETIYLLQNVPRGFAMFFFHEQERVK